LAQWLMGRQVLTTRLSSREHDQIKRLGQQINQHAIGRQTRAASAGQHATPLDTGNHHLDLGAAQHINQGHGLQVIDTFGDRNQGSKGHKRSRTQVLSA